MFARTSSCVNKWAWPKLIGMDFPQEIPFAIVANTQAKTLATWQK